MSDEPTVEVVRPATARPRGQPATATDQEPPTPDESAAIERSLLDLPRFSGGEVGDELGLGRAVEGAFAARPILGLCCKQASKPRSTNR